MKCYKKLKELGFAGELDKEQSLQFFVDALMPYFKADDANDVVDFQERLFEYLEVETKTEKKPSVVDQVFGFEYQIETKCNKCFEKESETKELKIFNVDKNTSIFGLIYKFFNDKEDIDDCCLKCEIPRTRQNVFFTKPP